MPGQPLGQALRRVFILNLRDDKCGAPDDTVVCNGDIGLGCFRLPILECVANLKPIQGVLSAVEEINRITAAQFLDPRRLVHPRRRRSKTLGLGDRA